MADYDQTLRYLADRHPEHWATWLLGRRPQACQVRESTLPNLERRADLLLEVTVDDETFLQHTEFQTEYDPDMTRRLLAYQVGGILQYRLPVRSVVPSGSSAPSRAPSTRPEPSSIEA